MRTQNVLLLKIGKLLAFCANSEDEIQWWDKNNISSTTIPHVNIQDDLTFIKKNINDYQYYKLQVEKLQKNIVEKIVNNSKIHDYEKIALLTAISKNKNASPEILEKLLKFENFDILEEIVNNPNCTKAILEKLCNYSNTKNIAQNRLKKSNYIK